MSTVALQPVTRNPDQLLANLEENFRRISAAMALPTPAAQILPGTLTGDFTISGGNLTLANNSLRFAVGPWRIDAFSDQIQFLFNGVAKQQFWSDGEVWCNSIGVGGDNPINAGIMVNNDWIRVKADRGIYFQDYGGGWYMSDTTWIRAYNNKNIHTEGVVGGNVARIGRMDAYGDFAEFSHANKKGVAGDYCLIQEWNGTTYLNSNTTVYIRWQNNNKLLIGSSSVEPKTNLAMYDNLIRTRAWNDDWHVMGWWSGNDGLRITEYGGLYYRVRDQDPHMRMEAYASTYFQRFDQLGGWDTAVLTVRSYGGGSPAMISWHAQGQNAAHIIKNWFSALECRSWDNGGWGIFRGELEDYSSAQSKKNIRRQKERINKSQRRTKQKKIEAAHFNRKRGGCPNCMGTGLAREHRSNSAVSDPVKREAAQVVAGLFGGHSLPPDDTPCPDCSGKGMAHMRPEDIKNEEAGWFGFISEELEKEFPEACYYRPSESDPTKIEVSGISVQAIVSILWEDNKDQQEEIDALEARLAALEKKK